MFQKPPFSRQQSFGLMFCLVDDNGIGAWAIEGVLTLLAGMVSCLEARGRSKQRSTGSTFFFLGWGS